jgi:PAP2 superfamily
MKLRALIVVVAAAALLAPASHATTLPPGNAAQQWDKIAEDTAVGSGAFQGEAFVYLAYVSSAMDGAVNPGERNGQSPDAAVAQAAYDVLVHYFPSQSTNLTALHDASLATVPDGVAKRNGIHFGDLAADKVLRDRANDGLMTPIATTSPFPTLPPGPGVYRLTPPAYAAPQTPWMVNMTPFVLQSSHQFLPPPPPSLQSQTWVDDFNEVESKGASNSTTRTADQTATARFWAANVNRQYEGLARSIATRMNLDVPESARWFAMANEVLADAALTFMNAKYHYLFWRPVTAIDPMSVTNDGFGTMPGPDDGNPLTAEQTNWRPLLTTPNHPEYPSAHSTVSAALAEVVSRFMGTDQINVTILGNTGFDASRTYATASAWFGDVADGRVFAGLHYRFSTTAGIALGKQVADYDLARAFSNGH